MENETEASERQTLHRKLLDSIKQCQVYLSGKQELVTESSSWVSCLCSQFENALQHNLRQQSSSAFSTLKQVATGAQQEPVNFWAFVKSHLPNDEIERMNKLKNITTDQGRGRAWLRCALNERSLQKYLTSMVNDAILLRTYYEKDALMYDEEIASTLPQMAAGLDTILFNIKYDDGSLDAATIGKQQNIFPAAILPNTHHHQQQVAKSADLSYEPKTSVPAQFHEKVRRRIGGKKKKANIITFSDEDAEEGNRSNLDLSITKEPAHLRKISTTSSNHSGSRKASSHYNLKHSTPTHLNRKLNNSFDHSGGGNSSSRVSNTSSPVAPTADEASSSRVRQLVGDNSVKSRSNTSSTVGGGGDPPFVDKTVEVADSNSPPTLQQLLNNRHPSVISTGHDLVMDDWASARSSSVSEALQIPAAGGNSTLEFFGNDVEPSTSSSIDTKSVDDDDDVVGNGDHDITSSAAAANFVLSLAKRSSVTLNNFSSPRSIGEKVNRNDFVPPIAAAAAPLSVRTATSSSTAVTSNSNEDSTLNANELHQALMAVMHRKDELTEKNKSMRGLLDQEMERSATLRKEKDQIENDLKESRESYEILAKESEKETEVLRNQLKKYVGAVQALQRGEENDDSAPRNHVLDVSEAEMYEKKLIDVTEMHAELMEFNERLLTRFKLAVNLMRNMKAELVDLRGPMPSDDQISRIESDNLDNGDNTRPASRALINIWMPSIYLIGKGPDAHHVYQVYVRIGEEEWNVYRRYSHFHELHIRLRKKFPLVDTFNFPPKRVMGNKGKRFVEDRRKQLQMYLRLLMNGLIQHHEKLVDKPDKETLINLLPFFSETSGLNKEIPEINQRRMNNRNR